MTIKLRCPDCGAENQMTRSGESGGTNPEAVSWADFIECAACGATQDVPPDVENQLRGPGVAPRLMEE